MQPTPIRVHYLPTPGQTAPYPSLTVSLTVDAHTTMDRLTERFLNALWDVLPFEGIDIDQTIAELMNALPLSRDAFCDDYPFRDILADSPAPGWLVVPVLAGDDPCQWATAKLSADTFPFAITSIHTYREEAVQKTWADTPDNMPASTTLDLAIQVPTPYGIEICRVENGSDGEPAYLWHRHAAHTRSTSTYSTREHAAIAAWHDTFERGIPQPELDNKWDFVGDRREARLEGWDVLEAHGERLDGLHAIQALNGNALLDTDQAAIEHVIQRALSGSDLHQRALQIHLTPVSALR